MIKNADGVLEFFWKHDAGPIENILGLVEYGYMFLGGFWGKAAVTIATILGLSLRNFGKKLDNLLHLTSLQDLANVKEDTAVDEAMFSASTLHTQVFMTKLGQDMDGTTIFNLLFSNEVLKLAGPKYRYRGRGYGRSLGLLSTLKTIAIKILGGGLLSFLTLKGIQALKQKDPDSPSEENDTNNTTERQVESSKHHLESAIREALAS